MKTLYEPHIRTVNAIEKELFGVIESKNVYLYTITNDMGMTMKVTNYGCIITSLQVPDNDRKLDDVVLGFDDLYSYLDSDVYLGCTVGRFCGRIANGRFTIEGKEYALATNNGPNALHGGIRGFDKKVWDVRGVWEHNGIGLTFTYESIDGEEGFPGKLSVTVTYLLTSENALWINYKACTDKPTIINLTNHSYFNLAGAGNGGILSHELVINANRFLVQDAVQIPTGEVQSVAGTPFDFRMPTPIGDRINVHDEQLRIGSGYDHTWVLDRIGNHLLLAAVVRDPVSRRGLKVFTTEPGIHLYTGNYLDNYITGKNDKRYGRRGGFCLETQHFPDSPNKPEFPTVVLKPKETFTSTTVYKFYNHHGEEN